MNKIETRKAITKPANQKQSCVKKKHYIKPKLTKYGKVTKITKGVGSSDFDEGSIVPDFV